MPKSKIQKETLKRLPLSVLLRRAESYDQKFEFEATKEHAELVWQALNHAVFGGVLTRPEKSIIQNRVNWDFWGECEGLQRGHRYGPHYTKTIRLQKKYPNPKKFIDTMAHEMCHQYEWEILGVMTHGKTFFAWKQKLAEKGIPLKVVF